MKRVLLLDRGWTVRNILKLFTDQLYIETLMNFTDGFLFQTF